MPLAEDQCLEKSALQEVEVQLLELGRKLRYLNPMDVRNLLNYPEESNAHYIPGDEEIIENVREENNVSVQCSAFENNNELDDSEELPQISISQALDSMKMVELCLLQQNDISPAMFTHVKQIRDTLLHKLHKKKTQRSIDSYFSRI
ncbi:hypothetical protein FRX31_015359 [Thalictrum thalictroides]|uniref:Uncharacterized protein n=1 Tax=Thalictrum thalictroides TaxID=46969 RepID=A0A7J6WDJ7_THATH|nr:hypothetical protein FRX31_015359 [Thalictrum thalictroides]